MLCAIWCLCAVINFLCIFVIVYKDGELKTEDLVPMVAVIIGGPIGSVLLVLTFYISHKDTIIWKRGK
jgi:hypothetical protein